MFNVPTYFAAIIHLVIIPVVLSPSFECFSFKFIDPHGRRAADRCRHDN
ncbi:hypothetical protein VR7878_00259 [Vibrio ruber DSM 16370]|uniref:Uncharacterized protein n=1 Tax=Vibrio ruber (strain DSM 16370 / JCM 11486 / BCRC 17186 / CECT 7878 / LMG 23124 / VR1) TaxID=1123498 RepID=A0A1R4L9P8_VIBR1|nr:hypothetical protein VR7878_00259 [Vibrio ruber DSM 16370]